MNKIDILLLTIGVAIGATATWFCVKKHYEKIAQEEIDSVKEVYAERTADEIKKAVNSKFGKDSIDSYVDTDEKVSEKDLKNYISKIDKEGYTAGHTCVEKRKGDSMNKPYIIFPEEFGGIEEYEQISLIYYSDGVLTDDMDDIIDDIDGTVGEGFASHFGEYEDDSVFVRNDRLKCDYEILRDYRTYEKVVGREP